MRREFFSTIRPSCLLWSSSGLDDNFVVILSQLLQRLCDADVDFVVIGGFAALLHGSTLVTRDLDKRILFTCQRLVEIVYAVSVPPPLPPSLITRSKPSPTASCTILPLTVLVHTELPDVASMAYRLPSEEPAITY